MQKGAQNEDDQTRQNDPAPDTEAIWDDVAILQHQLLAPDLLHHALNSQPCSAFA